jgi:hypothetical protein
MALNSRLQFENMLQIAVVMQQINAQTLLTTIDGRLDLGA